MSFSSAFGMPANVERRESVSGGSGQVERGECNRNKLKYAAAGMQARRITARETERRRPAAGAGVEREADGALSGRGACCLVGGHAFDHN